MIATAAEMMGWIEAICARGVRRPGYAADAWAEDFIRSHFIAFGLRDVRLEPVELPKWEPLGWSLEVDGERLECFPLPHTKPGTVEGTLGDDIALEVVTLNSWPRASSANASPCARSTRTSTSTRCIRRFPSDASCKG